MQTKQYDHFLTVNFICNLSKLLQQWVTADIFLFSIEHIFSKLSLNVLNGTIIWCIELKQNIAESWNPNVEIKHIN